MDAAAQIAMMAKAKLVFEVPQMFLSFPALSPLSYRPADLAFGKALEQPAIAAALMDFSRAVNCLPNGPIFRFDGDDYLWDRYDDWLNAMVPAASDLSSADQAAYAAARSLLVAACVNGDSGDSPALVAYKQCRDAAIDAEQAYKAAQITALNSGAAAEAAWRTADEPRLRTVVDAALAAWQSSGHKADIEAAQATVGRCEAHMPQQTWAEWRQAFTPDIDMITDAASNARYAPSGFAPADLTDQDWTTLRLTEPEIAALCADAPKPLRDVFGDVGSSEIGGISFEFRSAAVVRPWFSPAMFGARTWKFDEDTVLSDGATPPGGAWPCYVAAVIFMRNLQVAAKGATQAPQPVHALPSLALPPTVLQRLNAAPPSAGPLRTARPALPNARPVSGLRSPAMMRPALLPPEPAAASAPALALRAAALPHPVSRLDTLSYRAPPSLVRTGLPVTTPQAPTTPPPQAAPLEDRVSILAFLCRVLPKTPNPDPRLHW